MYDAGVSPPLQKSEKRGAGRAAYSVAAGVAVRRASGTDSLSSPIGLHPFHCLLHSPPAPWFPIRLLSCGLPSGKADVDLACW